VHFDGHHRIPARARGTEEAGVWKDDEEVSCEECRKMMKKK
jgi:hypothetical protein